VIAAAAYVRAVRHDRVLSARAALWHGAAILGVVLVSLWSWGFLTVRDIGDPGFGTYSADLLAFLNPGPWSTYLKPLASVRNNYETFDYLGAGVLVLLVACLALWAAGHRSSGSPGSPGSADARAGRASLGAAVVAAALLGVYALATPIRFGGHDLLYVGLYAPLHFLTSAFRGSARFTWPAYYLLMAVVLAQLDRRLTARAALVFALAALALQVGDLRPLRKALRADYRYPWPQLQSPLWNGLNHSYHALRLVPPIIAHRDACRRYGESDDYEIRFAVVAATEGMVFNSAALARADDVAPLCEPMVDSLRQGLVDPATVYVPNAGFREAMMWWTDRRLVCGTIDGANVCVSRAGASPLAAWLRAQESPQAPLILHVTLSNPGLPPAVDSAPGFAPAGPEGRLIPRWADGAQLRFARPFARPVTVHVEASAAGVGSPVALSVSLGSEARTLLVGAGPTSGMLTFGGRDSTSVLQFRTPLNIPAPPPVVASTDDTTGVRVKAVVIESQ
jgi:hypothetical protein